MALDSTIAASIAELKAKWDKATGDNAAINGGGGGVRLLFPVDKSSVIYVPVSGRVIRLLGITKDETPSTFKFFARPADDEANSANRAFVPGGASLTEFKKGFYRVYINLKAPISYKRKAKECKLRQVSIAIPYVVPISGVMVFLNKHCSTDLKPSTFETVNRAYRLMNIDYTHASLGEKSDKSELPEAQQSTEPAKKSRNSKK